MRCDGDRTGWWRDAAAAPDADDGYNGQRRIVTIDPCSTINALQLSIGGEPIAVNGHNDKCIMNNPGFVQFTILFIALVSRWLVWHGTAASSSSSTPPRFNLYSGIARRNNDRKTNFFVIDCMANRSSREFEY